tara:strand:+ start:9058 stop:9648 length:591 start_codon:yes stop_codon:yes gene_type:complete
MIRKITKFNIISLYTSNYDKRLYLREIAKFLKKPHQSIKPYIQQLVNENILIQEKRNNVTDFYLNVKNHAVFEYLSMAEKTQLIQKINQEIILKILYEKLAKTFTLNTYIIFGSAAQYVKKTSDIDLLIIGKKKINDILNQFEKVYNKSIHTIQVLNLENVSTRLIKEVYKKHIIMNNSDQVITFLRKIHEKNRMV